MTQGGDLPGLRFRILQHFDAFAAAGLRVQQFDARFGAYPPESRIHRGRWLISTLTDAVLRARKANQAQVCLLQRELVSTLISAEPLIRTPIVFDVDDALFAGSRGWMTDRIARMASLTICGNAYLADHYRRFCRVEILPTAVDTDRFVPGNSTRSEPIIGWSGSSSGLPYLYAIEDALLTVLRKYPDAILEVIADRAPRFRSLPAERVRFRQWSKDIEVAALQRFTVGLMPLPDNAWTRGKCSFKMLTYMAAAIPVVVSPVGMNSEILSLGPIGYAATTHDEWVDAISTLFQDRDSGARMGEFGRRIVESHFSKKLIGPRFAELIRSVSA